jgi:uncharacterized membrane protein
MSWHVNRRTQGLFKQLHEKIDETHVDLQEVRMSIDMYMRSPMDNMTQTKKDFHAAIVNTRNNLHEELSLMLHVKAQTMKAERRIDQERMEAKIKATLGEFQTQLKETEARAEHKRGKGTGVGVAKPPKINRTAS